MLLFLCVGNLGVFILSQLDLSAKYRKLFTDVIVMLKRVIARAPEPQAVLKRYQEEATLTMCTWEMLMPTYTYTIGAHQFLHIFDRIAELGPGPSLWMSAQIVCNILRFSAERYQYVLLRHKRSQVKK